MIALLLWGTLAASAGAEPSAAVPLAPGPTLLQRGDAQPQPAAPGTAPSSERSKAGAAPAAPQGARGGTPERGSGGGTGAAPAGRQQGGGAQPEPQRGENPRGQQPSGQNPRGEQQPAPQNPRGENPRGEQPSGQNPRGEQPSGQNPRGERPAAQNPRGENPRGENPRGENPRGENPRGEAGRGADELSQGRLRALLSHERNHREKLAKLNRLKELFAAKGDRDKVAQVDELITKENQQYRLQMASERDKLGLAEQAELDRRIAGGRSAGAPPNPRERAQPGTPANPREATPAGAPVGGARERKEKP